MIQSSAFCVLDINWSLLSTNHKSLLPEQLDKTCHYGRCSGAGASEHTNHSVDSRDGSIFKIKDWNKLFNKRALNILTSTWFHNCMLRSIRDGTLSSQRSMPMTEENVYSKDVITAVTTIKKKEIEQPMHYEAKRDSMHQTFVDTT